MTAAIETFLLEACKFSCPLQESPSEETEGKIKEKVTALNSDISAGWLAERDK